jgi:hypothetical protein
MKLKANEFWVLENKGSKGDKIIFDNLDGAVKSVKELMASETKPDDISLVAVDIGEKDWKIKQVPWSETCQKKTSLRRLGRREKNKGFLSLLKIS